MSNLDQLATCDMSEAEKSVDKAFALKRRVDNIEVGVATAQSAEQHRRIFEEMKCLSQTMLSIRMLSQTIADYQTKTKTSTPPEQEELLAQSQGLNGYSQDQLNSSAVQKTWSDQPALEEVPEVIRLSEDDTQKTWSQSWPETQSNSSAPQGTLSDKLQSLLMIVQGMRSRTKTKKRSLTPPAMIKNAFEQEQPQAQLDNWHDWQHERVNFYVAQKTSSERPVAEESFASKENSNNMGEMPAQAKWPSKKLLACCASAPLLPSASQFGLNDDLACLVSKAKEDSTSMTTYSVDPSLSGSSRIPQSRGPPKNLQKRTTAPPTSRFNTRAPSGVAPRQVQMQSPMSTMPSSSAIGICSGPSLIRAQRPCLSYGSRLGPPQNQYKVIQSEPQSYSSSPTRPMRIAMRT